MSYTPHIIPAIPSDIAAERHAAIAAKFYEINAAMLQFSCAKKADAVAHAAIALSKSGSGACGYASAVSAISAAAAAMGRKGGKSKSAAKKSAARENGKKGGRPTVPASIAAVAPATLAALKAAGTGLSVAVDAAVRKAAQENV